MSTFNGNSYVIQHAIPILEGSIELSAIFDMRKREPMPSPIKSIVKQVSMLSNWMESIFVVVFGNIVMVFALKAVLFYVNFV